MQQRPVVIMTMAQDHHAALVHYGLKALGCEAHMYIETDIIGAGDLSIDYNGAEPLLTLGDFRSTISSIGAVWNRRSTPSFKNPDTLHPADKSLAETTARVVLNGMVVLLDRQFAVNPIASARLFSSKLNQLQAAKVAGLRIPRTLISHRNEDVQAFVRREQSACVKPFVLHTWRTDTGIVISSTGKIAENDIDSAQEVEMMPMIYQEYIEKTFEYRLTIFGNYHVATQIDSQKNPGTSVDWRNSVSYLDDLSPATLPSAVIDAAKRLLKILGLRFGTLDLALTPEGEYVFFEVNEAGQFLWQELHCPDSVLMEPFIRYLISADDNFDWDVRQRSSELTAHNLFEAAGALPDYENHFRNEDLPEFAAYRFADERTIRPNEVAAM